MIETRGRWRRSGGAPRFLSRSEIELKLESGATTSDVCGDTSWSAAHPTTPLHSRHTHTAHTHTQFWRESGSPFFFFTSSDSVSVSGHFRPVSKGQPDADGRATPTVPQRSLFFAIGTRLPTNCVNQAKFAQILEASCWLFWALGFNCSRSSGSSAKSNEFLNSFLFIRPLSPPTLPAPTLSLFLTLTTLLRTLLCTSDSLT